MYMAGVEPDDEVAPRAGAWIETALGLTSLVGTKSPPVRGRGLKPFYGMMSNIYFGRPPCGGVD